jgi:hypothetical protein
MHWHAIGVPEEVTLLEFEPNLEEQPPEQEVQAPRRSTRRRHGGLFGSHALQLHKRQAPEHYKPPNF